MIKQSSAVLALFLGTTDARMKMRAPKSINLFATGMNGDEDLGQDIIMKGDKYHYQQLGQVEIQETNAPRNTQPVRARDDAKEAAEPKKEEKKEEKKAEKKDAKAGAKKEEKKADAKDEKKADAKDEKADAKADAKEEKKDGKDEEKKDGKDDEKKDEEEKKDQKPGEATWEDHNDCKGNEWEAPDGNCAFEAEAVKIASHDHHHYSAMDASLVQVDYPQQFSQGPGQPKKGWWNDPEENRRADVLSQTHYQPWVRHLVKEAITSTPNSGRAETMEMPESQITYPHNYIAEAAKPSGTRMSLSQWSQHDFNGNPERVHIIDPVTYQDRANSGSYLGNKRTTFYAQGDDQPAGTNQGSNQLINTAKNLDWAEGQYRAKFSPPSNVAVPKGIFKNVIQEGQKAEASADARKAAAKVVEEKPAPAKPVKEDKEPSLAKETKKELNKALEKVEEGEVKKELKDAKKDVAEAAEEAKDAAEADSGDEAEAASGSASGSASASDSEGEEEVQMKSKKHFNHLGQVKSKKYDTCINGSCQTPQWPGEVLPGSEPVLRIPSSPVDDGYEPTLNSVFDNRFNVQLNEQLNQREKQRKYDPCANGSCQTPQWPGEVLPGSEPVLRIPSSPVDDGYEPTLHAVFDNRWN